MAAGTMVSVLPDRSITDAQRSVDYVDKAAIDYLLGNDALRNLVEQAKNMQESILASHRSALS